MHDGSTRIKLGRMHHPVRGLLHGAAALLSIVGGAALVLVCPAEFWRQAALLVFAASLVALFTTSSLYHSIPWGPHWKTRMQRLDHSMIYLVVAGTYTPMTFIVLDGMTRAAALVFVWGIAAVGIWLKLTRPVVDHRVSVTLQTLQGWAAVLLIAPLAERLPGEALALLVAGGAAYTVGMVAFVTERPRLWPRVFSYHEVFHILVVAGSALHYTMTLLYVARFPGT